MASINLGRVGFVLRGTWSSSASYQPLDVVLYNGSSYAARIASTGVAPSNGSTWQELTDISSAVASGISASAVKYDENQSLNGAQKTVARENIGAASIAMVDNLGSRVTAAENNANIAIAKANTMEPTVNNLSARMTAAEGDIEQLQSDLNNKIKVSGTTLVIS